MIRRIWDVLKIIKSMDKEKFAQFHVGQRVRHKLFDYRGVVFNVDAVFSSDDDWYEHVARSRPPKDAPWYHVLPNGEQHTTYVAERNLEADASRDAIAHPLITKLFGDVNEDGYIPREKLN
jgi:heat shock protein HspQ